MCRYVSVRRRWKAPPFSHFTCNTCFRFTNNSPTLTSPSALSGSPAVIKTQKRTIASCMFPPLSKCHDEAPGALLLDYSGEIWLSYQTHRTNRAPPSYANQRYSQKYRWATGGNGRKKRFRAPGEPAISPRVHTSIPFL